MITYVDLLLEAHSNNIIAKEKPLRAYKGRIKGNKIAIKKDMAEKEKKCILAEEIGHYHTGCGDILDQGRSWNRKQEQQARFWAYNKLIGLNGIVNSYKHGCHNLYEMAEYLDVTEAFLADAIERYRSKYGVFTTLDNFIIYFEPNLTVTEITDPQNDT